SASVVVLAHAASALAQSGGAPASPANSAVDAAPEEDDNSGVIIVTAQKRAEDVQDVPIAITTVAGPELKNSGIENLQQLNVVVPGLNSRQNLGGYQPTIRGIGTGSQVTESPVAIYIDGVYLPQQRDGLRELPDVEQ